MRLGVRRDHLLAGHRVLFVDDGTDTGEPASGARFLVDQAQAMWCGAAVLVDAPSDNRARRDWGVRALFRVRDL